MTSLGRAFVAVVPPDHVLDAIDARVAPVRAAHDELRWSRRAQWHLTLRFLGPVPDVDGLLAVLRHELASAPAIPALQLAGAGAFPNVQRASVAWLGLRGAVEELTVVAAAVESAAVAVGFVPEPRPFAPHLTVARVPRPRDVAPIVELVGDEAVGDPWSVDEVVLISSDTRPAGAVYTEIARVPLA